MSLERGARLWLVLQVREFVDFPGVGPDAGGDADCFCPVFRSLEQAEHYTKGRWGILEIEVIPVHAPRGGDE